MASSVTFALIKPESFSHPFVCWSIVTKILESGFSVLAAKVGRVPKIQAESFYKVHQDKFFYGRLVAHMTSGPVMALILGGPRAIERWRELLGPTKVARTVVEHPNTLRGQYGLTDTRNVGHGSDNLSTATMEANFFFPEFCNLDSASFKGSLPSESLSRRRLFELIFGDTIPYKESIDCLV